MKIHKKWIYKFEITFILLLFFDTYQHQLFIVKYSNKKENLNSCEEVINEDIIKQLRLNKRATVLSCILTKKIKRPI